MMAGGNRVLRTKLALVAVMRAGTFTAGRVAVAEMFPESTVGGAKCS